MTSVDAPAFELQDAVRDLLVGVVGREHSLVTDEERDTYRDPYWYQADRTYDSSLVLFPESTEQVQAIVRIANEHEVPLWASSQGRNNGYGGPSPRVKGSVLISFRRMNRVLEYDEQLGYAVVEPGVRWFDLYDVLHERGDQHLLSIPDIGWGSIVGNSLDNGMTYLPLGTDFQAPTGMEVVLADGSLLRTGMGAMEGNPSFHLYKRGLGPDIQSLFTQGNFGIVVKMGVWLMKRPKAYRPMYLMVPRDHQMAQAVDILRELRQEGVVRGVPLLENLILQGVHFPEHFDKFPAADATWSDERLDALADETGIGRWGVRTHLWGEPGVIDLHEARIRDAWSEIEGSRVDTWTTYTAENWGDLQNAGFIDKIGGGVPTLMMIERMPDFVGHIGFSPVVPLVGTEVEKVSNIIKQKVIAATGGNYTSAIFPTNDRSAIIVSSLIMNRDDEASVQAAFATAKDLLVALSELGYGEYRAHLDFMDLASEQYAYGDHAYQRFVRAIKDAVDPKGILAPGRHGVWPEKYR